ncbi:MAG: L-threonylcarbamoyladenylate synthase [Smithellaceae bacterium]
MPEILKVDSSNSEEAVLSRATEILIGGGVIAYPTETFYGLGADATNEKAIRKIYAIKGRNFSSPISVIIACKENLYPLVGEVPECAEKLMQSFWPGPLTIVFKASISVSSLLTAQTGKIGIRISSHTGARLIVQKLGHPLTATSANLSGAPECSTAAEVATQIGDRVDVILDLGKTAGGLGSTIIDITTNPPQILREGIINRLAISQCGDFQ